MLGRFSHLINACLPIRIGKGDSEKGGRIGGRPPSEVYPKVISDSTRYFLTLPVDKNYEISLFLSIGEPRSADDVISQKYKLHSAASPLMQFVIHREARRGDANELESELSGHSLIIQSKETDKEDNPLDDHKVGGWPLYYQDREPIISEVEELQSKGYIHLLQLGFPTHEDGDICGDWPFGEFYFHVYAKEDQNKIDFHYGWA